MIRRAIILIVQRFLWKKLLKGSLKSKIFTILSLVVGIVLAGALFAMFQLNMTFMQGVWWTWSYIEGSLSSLFRLF